MLSVKDNLRRRILLSQDPSFPPESTFEFMTDAEAFTPPHALFPAFGMCNCWTHAAAICRPRLCTFTAAALPVGYAVKVSKDFPNGVFAPRAELKVSFIRHWPRGRKSRSKSATHRLMPPRRRRRWRFEPFATLQPAATVVKSSLTARPGIAFLRQQESSCQNHFPRRPDNAD